MSHYNLANTKDRYFVQQSRHFVQDGGIFFDSGGFCRIFALERCLTLKSVKYERDDDCMLYAVWYCHSICTVYGLPEC